MTGDRLAVEAVHDALSALFKATAAESVEFDYRQDPPHDPHDDYRVTYEAIFLPTAIDQMRAEVWVTDTGHLGIGIETEARVARRLSARRIPPRSSDRFAWGFEPAFVRLEGALFLLRLAARGELDLEAPKWWWGLGSTRAVVEPAARATMADLGLRGLRGVGDKGRVRLGMERLVYRPWA